MKKFVMKVKETKTGGLTSDFTSEGFNGIEIIGAIERAKYAILKSILEEDEKNLNKDKP